MSLINKKSLYDRQERNTLGSNVGTTPPSEGNYYAQNGQAMNSPFTSNGGPIEDHMIELLENSITSTNNSYSMYAPTTVNVRQTVRSYCFTANSGDHPAGDAYQFDPSHSENQRYNTFGNSVDIYKSDVTDNQSNDFGFGLRLEFRKASGEANNDKTFRRDNGTFYTVAKANLGGLPVTNAKIAVSNVPCGYGFMNSTFMGF